MIRSCPRLWESSNMRYAQSKPCKRIPTIVLTIACLIGSMQSTKSVAVENTPLTYECLKDAAAQFGHTIKTLSLILAVEGGKVGQCSSNTNGSVDCGPAQINSIHFPQLARITGMTPDQVRDAVTSDGCFNIYVGAYLLRKTTNSANGDLLTGIGHYHSYTPYYMNRYIDRVQTKALQYFGNSNVATNTNQPTE